MSNDFKDYRYCGLIVRSTLPLPELPVLTDAGAADVTLREASVPSRLPKALFRRVTFDLAEDEAIYRLDGIARYRVAERGRLIEVDFAPRAEAAAVRLFLLDPVFALAAVMRGEYLLRAAAVGIDGQAVAFVGPSASGKSTAAALLTAAGHPLLSDCLLRVVVTPSGQALAYPQAPWLQLWPDAVNRLRLDADAKSIRTGLPLMRVSRPCAEGPLPLARIAVLREQRGNDLDLFEPTRRKGARGVGLLADHSAGNAWLGGFPRQCLHHFQLAVHVAGAVSIGELEMPWGWERLGQLEAALSDWSAGR